MQYKYKDGPLGPQNDEMRKVLKEEVLAYQRWLRTTNERVGDIHLLLIKTKYGCVFFPKLITEPFIADNEFVITPEMDAGNVAIVLQTEVADLLINQEEETNYKDVLANLIKQMKVDAIVYGATTLQGQAKGNLYAVLKAAYEIAQGL